MAKFQVLEQCVQSDAVQAAPRAVIVFAGFRLLASVVVVDEKVVDASSGWQSQFRRVVVVRLLGIFRMFGVGYVRQGRAAVHYRVVLLDRYGQRSINESGAFFLGPGQTELEHRTDLEIFEGGLVERRDTRIGNGVPGGVLFGRVVFGGGKRTFLERQLVFALGQEASALFVEDDQLRFVVDVRCWSSTFGC